MWIPTRCVRRYSKVRGGYVKDVHYSNIIMGNVSRAALSVDSGYGSQNPACGDAPKPMPVPTIAPISSRNVPVYGTCWHRNQGLRQSL